MFGEFTQRIANFLIFFLPGKGQAPKKKDDRYKFHEKGELKI